jgi:hypothetical protein
MTDKRCPKCKLYNPPTAQRCDCGYDFQSGTAKESSIASVRGKAEKERAEKDPERVAKRKIDTACGVALLLVVITLAPKFYAISQGVSVSDTLPFMYDGFIMLTLAAWLYFKRSLAASIMLFVFYLFSIFSIYTLLFSAGMTPEQATMLGKILSRKIIIIAIVIYTLFQGILGAYSLKRLYVNNAFQSDAFGRQFRWAPLASVSNFWEQAIGIFKFLFRKARNREGDDMTFERAAEIAGAYGAVLEYRAPTPGMVADSSNLPYPKNEIKKAIVTLLNSDVGSEMNEHLRATYILLGNWQEGVGSRTAGVDFTNMDLNVDPRELAMRIVEQGASGDSWVEKANEERQNLLVELRQLGFK